MQAGLPKDIHILLASNSPRRKDLLSLTGWQFSIQPPQVDETPLPGEGGVEYVQRLARLKVEAAADQAGVNGVIIAADTTVIIRQVDGTDLILAKPANRDEAVAMLRLLRGSTHQVHTAIAILSKRDDTLAADLCTTDVPMRDIRDDEIEAYVASGDPLDKAGAYAIQHAGFHPVEALNGCFANVMGLPLCHLTRSLRKFGITPKTDLPRVCQAALGYNCPVHSQIL
jgi:MAF protein